MKSTKKKTSLWSYPYSNDLKTGKDQIFPFKDNSEMVNISKEEAYGLEATVSYCTLLRLCLLVLDCAG